MKKAIIAFTILLILSIISTVCFAAATGTKVIKSAVQYFADNGVRNISDIDKLGDELEKFIRDKIGTDLDIHISFDDDEQLEEVDVDSAKIKFDDDENLEEIIITSDEAPTNDVTEEVTEEPVE